MYRFGFDCVCFKACAKTADGRMPSLPHGGASFLHEWMGAMGRYGVAMNGMSA